MPKWMGPRVPLSNPLGFFKHHPTWKVLQKNIHLKLFLLHRANWCNFAYQVAQRDILLLHHAHNESSPHICSAYLRRPRRVETGISKGIKKKHVEARLLECNCWTVGTKKPMEIDLSGHSPFRDLDANCKRKEADSGRSSRTTSCMPLNMSPLWPSSALRCSGSMKNKRRLRKKKSVLDSQHLHVSSQKKSTKSACM